MTDFISEMQWRGLIAQTTGEEKLRAHLAGGVRKAYVGFDPTADSLTIGNLVGIMVLVRFAKAGHQPVVVVGGGTGLIGDPSGKSAERLLLTPEGVDANVRGQTRIFDAIWKQAGLGTPPIRNNYEWLAKLSYLEALRDVGKHFSVNMMIQKESVKERLHNRDQGISYTEFSYMILQAYDYKYLWEHDGVTMQMGGSDQFGNIVCGADLIDKQWNQTVALLAAHEEAQLLAEPTEVQAREQEIERLERWLAERAPLEKHGLTWPLVTKTDGGKFGKTESGAVWLTADRTSPYAFYQFWLNSADADIPKFLRIFTLMSEEQVKELDAKHAANAGAREAHRALAQHMTTLLHGEEQMLLAEKAAQALFSGEIAGLPRTTLEEALASVPSSTHALEDLEQGVALAEFLVKVQLASSMREAKEFLKNGSVSANGRKVGIDDKLTGADLLHGSMIALRRGKKNWHLTRWE
ncbi:MAG: tyrosine--tRNA ligase [Planctomycetota bacterium]